MTTWIVAEGKAWVLGGRPLPRRDDYGNEWIMVEARDEAHALAQAQAWDNGGDAEMAMYAAAYRSGAVGIPGDRLVGVSEVAAATGVKRDTVHAWRNRHLTFPDPVQELDMGPVWWLSDVLRWTAVERRPGARRKV